MLKGRLFVAGLTALVAMAAADAGAESRRKLDAALQQAARIGASTPRVIVRTRPVAREAVRRKLLAHGARVHGENGTLETITATVHTGDLAMLAADPDVESVSIDAVVASDAARNTSASTAVTGATDSLSFLKNVLGIGSLKAGSSVVVAVIDSGIALNDDFTGRVLGQYEFTNGQGGFRGAPYDEYGHGTHVAGLIGSSGSLSSGKYEGVAPLVRLVSLKVLDKNGKGRTSDVIQAIEWAVANKKALGISVVNISLGHPIYEPAATDPLVLAVEHAVRAGLVVVTSAGNFGANTATGLPGYGGITSPGNAPSAITVGATNPMGTYVLSDDRVVAYSSRGPTWYDGMAKPDVVAPGQGLVSDSSTSSTLESYAGLVVMDANRKFLRLSGSSMATAVVSGVAALMIDLNRSAAEQRARQTYGGRYVNSGLWVRPADLSPSTVKALLEYTSVKLHDGASSEYDALTQGAGEVTGVGALYAAYALDTTIAVGSKWTTLTIVPSITLGGETLPLAQRVVWGNTMMTGSGLLNVRQASWDENIVWGTSDGENIVWGTCGDDENIVWRTSIFVGPDVIWSGSVTPGENIVWGTGEVWDENIVWGTGLIGATSDGENIVWGTTDGENIVWGTLDDEDIDWATSNYAIRASFFMGGGF